MADGDNNPSYYQTSQLSSKVQAQEHVFTLYAFQQYGTNERTIVAPAAGLPNRFGCTNVIDWAVRDGPNANATLVARLQGQMASVGRTSSRWHTSADLVFQDQRFKGSVLCVQGTSSSPSNPGGGGYWAVVGGTGEFAYAQGLIRRRIRSVNRGISTICEFDIRVQCLTTSPDQEGDDDRNNPDDPNDDGDQNNPDDPDDDGDRNNPDDDGDRNNPDDPNDDGDQNNPDDPDDDGDRNNPDDPNDDGDRNNPDDPNDDGDRNNPDDDGNQNNPDGPNDNGDPNDDGDQNNPDDNGDPNNDGEQNNPDDPNDRNDPNGDGDRNNPDDN